jgi:hypothetical protein
MWFFWIVDGLPRLVTSRPFTELETAIGKLEIVHRPEFFTVDFRWIYPAPSLSPCKFLSHSSYQGNAAIAAHFLLAKAILVPSAADLAGRYRIRGR